MLSHLKDDPKMVKEYEATTKKYDIKFLGNHRETLSLRLKLVLQLKLDDLDPALFTLNAPVGTVYHTVAHVFHPYNSNEALEPSQIFQGLKLKVFNKECFENDFFDDVISQLPSRLRQVAEGLLVMNSKQDWIDLVFDSCLESDFFDKFFQSKFGHRKKHVIERLTQSRTKKGPRRTNFSDDFCFNRYERKTKCCSDTLYSYTLSFTHRFDWHSRSIVPYQHFANFKINIWKKLRSHLTGLCQFIPPTQCTCLVYPRIFSSKINPHKDMNPRMHIDARLNSQLVSSDVIVVSFYQSQWFKFLEKKPGEKNSNKLWMTMVRWSVS